MQNQTVNIPLYYETHHAEEAAAPWLLFIHGAGGSTRTWRKQVEAYQGKFNLLLIDLPGHARSVEASLHQHHYDFEWIGNKIWEVVDILRIQTVDIIAVSLGSIIAMQMRFSRPNAVSTMVFAGPIVALNLKLRTLARTGLTLAKIIGYQNFYAMTARITLPRNNHKKSRDIFVRESKQISDIEYKKWTAMYGKTLDRTLKLLFEKAVDVPVLFMIGAQDHLFMGPAMDYAKKCSNVIVELVDRCGHLVSLEKSEIFNGKCHDFLVKFKS
ncbi:MAG: alpha/beta fold hydrolase [Flavobacteriales bacterium]